MFILSLGACKKEQVDIAVLTRNLSNPYWKTIHTGFTDAAQTFNKKIYIQGPRTDDDAEGQLSQCETALLRKPKALIFSAVNDVNLLPCLKRASEQKILLVNVDTSIDLERARKMGINIQFSIASDNYELGKKAASFLNGKSGNVLIIEGMPGNEVAQLRKKGFVENLPKNISVVASLSGNWDRLKSANITNDVLIKHPDLAYIYAANDVMALGAVEAIQVKGNHRVQVIGIDGTYEAVKAIKEGRMTASIAQLPYLIAYEAIEKSINYLEKGVKYDYNQYVPILALDKKTLTENKEPLLKYVR